MPHTSNSVREQINQRRRKVRNEQYSDQITNAVMIPHCVNCVYGAFP